MTSKPIGGTKPAAPPPAGTKWWSRPAYYFARYGGERSEFTWTCAFCPRRYDGEDDYCRVGFVCECGARFVPDGDSWMWGYVPESYNQTEAWM